MIDSDVNGYLVAALFFLVAAHLCAGWLCSRLMLALEKETGLKKRFVFARSVIVGLLAIAAISVFMALNEVEDGDIVNLDSGVASVIGDDQELVNEELKR